MRRRDAKPNTIGLEPGELRGPRAPRNAQLEPLLLSPVHVVRDLAHVGSTFFKKRRFQSDAQTAQT